MELRKSERVLLLLSCFSIACGVKHAAHNSSTSDPKTPAPNNFSKTLDAVSISKAVINADNSSGTDTDADLEPRVRFNAEFLTFTAPEEEDTSNVEDLLGLIQPKRVVLLDTPDTADVIELANQQLVAKEPLDIYLLPNDIFGQDYEEEQPSSTAKPAKHK